MKKACEHNGNASEITTKELEKYIKKSQTEVIRLKNEIDKSTEQALYEKKLVNKKGKEEKTKILAYMILLFVCLVFSTIFWGILTVEKNISSKGIMLFILVTLIELVVYFILFSKINVLTQTGTDEKAKWKGLKKYMEDFSMLDKREIPEIVIWEKFLVYATVFGIADKVLKQLKIVYPNITEQMNVNSYGYMYLMMNTNFSNSFSHAITNSMSSAYSSASGGGGGFSGGGRRPDGGRRRRWRKIDQSY